MPSPNINLAIPFFMVNDMETSMQFYVNKLGFEITKQWTPSGKIEWCWLQRDAVSIMLQEPRNKKIAEQKIPNGKGISICFQCIDALALYHEFIAKGVDIKEPFVGNNMWVVCFPDPDGYKLDFESPTDVPEETTYSKWLEKIKIK
jgi:lactoylglutathione lyase